MPTTDTDLFQPGRPILIGDAFLFTRRHPSAGDAEIAVQRVADDEVIAVVPAHISTGAEAEAWLAGFLTGRRQLCRKVLDLLSDDRFLFEGEVECNGADADDRRRANECARMRSGAKALDRLRAEAKAEQSVA